MPDDAAAPVGVGVVVPVTAGPTAEGLLTADELVELTGPEGSLTNILDAVEGTEAILAVDPAIPAAIRVLGSSAPPTALLWLARLEALPQTRFALQFGDADVAAQVQAGIVPPLRAHLTAGLSRTRRLHRRGCRLSRPRPRPRARRVDPTAPVYPDTATLLGIGQARAGRVLARHGHSGDRMS